MTGTWTLDFYLSSLIGTGTDWYIAEPFRPLHLAVVWAWAPAALCCKSSGRLVFHPDACFGQQAKADSVAKSRSTGHGRGVGVLKLDRMFDMMYLRINAC